ncbi:MAG: SulP family inorganic anion transporter [Xanthomonadales bacterium]|nr:SulP family inorganic anion transporter [Xanthomonadales bacterium]
MNLTNKIRQGAVYRTARDTLGQLLSPFRLPEWLPELRDRNVLKADAIAGLTVALVLIPQSMAYAQLAGLPPYYGLYASLLPTMIAAFFGSSRQLATGPVAMVSLMTAAALEPLATAGGEAYVGYALVLSFMVGVFQLAMGMFRLGVLLNFLSHPVVAGFVNAAAIIIATSQLGKIFGVTADKGDYHIEFITNIVREALSNTHWPTFGMAALAFAIMLAVRRRNPKLPAVLAAVVVTTLISWISGYARHETVELNQIGTQNIRTALLYDTLSRKHIANLQDRYIGVQQEFKAKSEEVDEEGESLLTHRQNMEQIEFLLKQKKEESQSHHEELFNTLLYATGSGDQMMFYTAEEIAEHLPDGEKDNPGVPWSIKAYKNNKVMLEAGGMVVGNVPRGLPGFRLPSFDWNAVTHLIGAMITISLIGFMEAISIARAMAAKTRQNLNPDRELMGQGMANLAGSLFQAYPVSGSFSRSAVNFNSGAVTGFSSIVSVAVVALALLFLTPLFYYLPQATLAAVIIKAVSGLVSLRPMIHAWRANRHDGVVAFVTFSVTLVLAPELEFGILLGMVLSLVLLLFRIMKPRVVFPPLREDLLPEDAVKDGVMEDGRIVRMRFEGPLVFANVAFFEEQLQKLLASSPRLKVLIIDAVSINEIDASGEHMLRDYYRRLTESGVHVLFTRVRMPVRDMFEQTRLHLEIGREFFHRYPVKACGHAWELILASQDEAGKEVQLKGPDEPTYQ